MRFFTLFVFMTLLSAFGRALGMGDYAVFLGLAPLWVPVLLIAAFSMRRLHKHKKRELLQLMTQD
jgi:hypothetical protein